MDEAAVSGHGAATDYHACSATLTQKGDNGEDSVGADKDSGHLNEGQSFHTTHLGKIPPEIREKIFINLLALPPPFAGRDIAKQDTNTSHDLAANGHVKSSTTPCYHLKGSWLQTLQTCRQIYLEAFPVFYGRKSYYTANAQELVSLFHFGRSGSPGALAFRGDGITSLCVKGFARHRIDSMWAGCGNYSPQYEDSPAISAASKLQGWKNLRKISLCMISHEEEAYLKFLFRLPGLEHGIVDFLDESHWSIHPQYRGSEWNIQYAVYTDNRDDLKDVDKAKIMDCHHKTYSNSDTYGLKPGDERYVEVDITRGDNPEYMTTEKIKAAIEATRNRRVRVAGTAETSHARSRKRRDCCSQLFGRWTSSSS